MFLSFFSMRLLQVFENPKTPYVNSNVLQGVELSFCSDSFSKSKHECTLYRDAALKAASPPCLSLRPSSGCGTRFTRSH